MIFIGKLGCLLSHIRAINAIYHLKLPYGIIMEDDMTSELYPFWRGINTWI